MEQPPRDIQQLIARLMATNPTEPQAEEEQLEQLRQDVIRLFGEILNYVGSVRHYHNDILTWHMDLQRRERELQALKEEEQGTEEQTIFTDNEVGTGKCYFRVLKKFEKYANKPYKNIWTRYDKLRNILKYITEREDLPRLSRSRADTLLDDMERKICHSIEDVIVYTKRIYIQCLLIAGNNSPYDALKDLKTAAIDLKDKVNNEISN